jgi:hypothetical protein
MKLREPPPPSSQMGEGVENSKNEFYPLGVLGSGVGFTFRVGVGAGRSGYRQRHWVIRIKGCPQRFKRSGKVLAD